MTNKNKLVAFPILKETLEETYSKGTEAQIMITSPIVKHLYEKWFYNWSNRINWNMLIAPRYTRFIYKLRDFRKNRIPLALDALRGRHYCD